MAIEKPNYTQVPNDLFDYLPTMTEAELKVTLCLVRLTLGFHRKERRASLSELQEMTGLSRPTVISGVEAAEQRGLLKRFHEDNKPSLWQIDAPWLEDAGKDFLPAKRIGSKKSLPGSKKSLPELVKNSYHASIEERKDKETVEKENIAVSSDTSKSSSPELSARTPASQLLFSTFRRKRWNNTVQRDEFEATEQVVGSDIMQQAIRWAAVKNIVDVSSICTAAKKWGKKQAGHSPPPGHRKPSGDSLYSVLNEMIEETSNGHDRHAEDPETLDAEFFRVGEQAG